MNTTISGKRRKLRIKEWVAIERLNIDEAARLNYLKGKIDDARFEKVTGIKPDAKLRAARTQAKDGDVKFIKKFLETYSTKAMTCKECHFKWRELIDVGYPHLAVCPECAADQPKWV